MKELAILLRMMQLYSHNAHNNAGGPTFFEDHKFLGKLYPQYEADYDSVVERIIGLYGVAALDLHKVQEQAILMQDTMPALQPDNKIYFATILECEHKLCRHAFLIVKKHALHEQHITVRLTPIFYGASTIKRE